jgi:hypothetical protein
MGLWAVLEALPAGYVVTRGRRGWLACEVGARETLAAAGFGPDGGESLPDSGLSGRAALGLIRAEGESWIVRRFHHGGLFAFLGERLFLRPARPFHELAHAAVLRASGFPTPRIVAARAVRGRPFGWRLALVSARIEQARDGADVLDGARGGRLPPSERKALLRTAGELVGRLHAAGFRHADLHPKNLLFGPDSGSAWVVDLDRGRARGELGRAARRASLWRLDRGVRKYEALHGPCLSRADRCRFLVAYAGLAGDRADWRVLWRSIARQGRLWTPLHRLGWRLGGAGRA